MLIGFDEINVWVICSKAKQTKGDWLYFTDESDQDHLCAFVWLPLVVQCV